MRVRDACIIMTHRADDREVVGQRNRRAASPPDCARAVSRARACVRTCVRAYMHVCVREAARNYERPCGRSFLAHLVSEGLQDERFHQRVCACASVARARAAVSAPPSLHTCSAATRSLCGLKSSHRGKSCPHSPRPSEAAALGTARPVPGRGGCQGGGAARASLGGAS